MAYYKVAVKYEEVRVFVVEANSEKEAKETGLQDYATHNITSNDVYIYDIVELQERKNGTNK